MKILTIAIVSAGFAASLCAAAYADSPRPGHNNAEMFQQIDNSGNMQANAGTLNNLAPAAGGNQVDWSSCKREIGAFCQESKGDDKLSACLQEHSSDLSKKCDDMNAQVRAK